MTPRALAPSMRRALFAISACAVAMASVAGPSIKCGPGSKCPEDSPCCSADGQCGGGAAQCIARCHPAYSFQPTSCVPNPICHDMDLDVKRLSFDDANMFRPLLQFNGDPHAAPFVFESGYLGAGEDGVLLEMNAPHDSVVATSQYMLYGTVTARLRHNATHGFGTTFGTVSDVGDAALFMLGGTNVSHINTNYYALGQDKHPGGTAASSPKHFAWTDWHNYTIDWQPDTLTWSVDGRTVRTVKRSKAGAAYPRSPSRVQLTAQGITSTAKRPIRTWAGGTISYKDHGYRSRGYYAQELSHLSIKCADQKLSNASYTGVGEEATAYIYTGKNSTTSGEPEFQLLRDQISLLPDPARNGRPGQPGFPGASSHGSHPNMFSGGTGIGASKQPSAPSSQSSSSHSGASNGVKVGIPVGIGGAALLGALALLLYYFVRRRKKARAAEVTAPRPPRTPVAPSVADVPPTAPPVQATDALDTHDRAYHAYPTVHGEGEAVEDLTPVSSDLRSHGELAYYQDPYVNEAVYLDADDDARSQSTASESAHHMHYAGHGAMRRYNPRLTAEENENIAARDAWDELRSAALGEAPSYFQSRGREHRPVSDIEDAKAVPRMDWDEDTFFSSRPSHELSSPYHRPIRGGAYTSGGALNSTTIRTSSMDLRDQRRRRHRRYAT